MYYKYEYSDWEQAAARGPRRSIPRYGWAILSEFAEELDEEFLRPGFFRSYTDNLREILE